MVATMTCQANMQLKFGKNKASPSGVPLQQPLGYSRPQTATFAASGALAYGSGLLTATVRKANAKIEEISSDDSFSSLLGRREKSQAGKPTFRSALEQVSYETNSSLSEEADKAGKKQTIVSRVARMFGR